MIFIPSHYALLLLKQYVLLVRRKGKPELFFQKIIPYQHQLGQSMAAYCFLCLLRFPSPAQLDPFSVIQIRYCKELHSHIVEGAQAEKKFIII